MNQEQKRNRLLKCILALSLLICLMSAAAWAIADSQVTVEFTAEYPYETVRRMLKLINEFRTREKVWYWNEDNKTRTVFNDPNNPKSVWLQPVQLDYGLERMAMTRAGELAVSYYPAHYRPTGEVCFTAVPYDEDDQWSGGENIAFSYGKDKKGQFVAFDSIEDVMRAWIEEDEDYDGQGHRRTMLSPVYTHVGIGLAYISETYGFFWAQEFGTPATNMKEDRVSSKTRVAASTDILSYNGSGGGISEVRPSVKTLKIKVGKSVAAPTVSARSSERTPITITDIEWETSDPSVVQYRNGKIKGVGAGTASLWWTNSYGRIIASVDVTVTGSKNPSSSGIPTKITLNITSKTVKLSKVKTLKLKATADVEGAELTWKSSNTNVATVDGKGKVTFVGKGKVKITVCSVENSKIKATCSLKVK